MKIALFLNKTAISRGIFSGFWPDEFCYRDRAPGTAARKSRDQRLLCFGMVREQEAFSKNPGT